MMTPSPLTLGPEWLDSSIRVLAAALADDPTVGYLCRHSGPATRQECATSTSGHHPQSQGVALDTGKVANVPLYQRFGYTVTRTDKIGPLDPWCRFRPNQVDRDGARVESRREPHERTATEPQ